QVSRLNEISLQTNIIALDADIEDDQKIDKSLVLETIAAKTKKLSLQMVQVSQDTQSFIDNTMLHIEEGKHINQNMSQLLETTKDNIYKSNQFLKKYLLADQKTQKNYQDIFHAMGSADHITEENVLGSKQVIAEMQELRTWSVMMYDDIIKIALVMGIDLKEQHIGMHTEHAFNHLSNNPDENISLMLENKEDIEHELSKL
ncbi:MAG: hypothetical protein OEW60_07700, partial [Thiovulaceae bacterium]|nr:hypothetical protein [Sulfurimonadaceae bacterium]